ncbi:MAG: hypothetical protein V1821_02110 [bacterium]
MGWVAFLNYDTVLIRDADVDFWSFVCKSAYKPQEDSMEEKKKPTVLRAVSQLCRKHDLDLHLSCCSVLVAESRALGIVETAAFQNARKQDPPKIKKRLAKSPAPLLKTQELTRAELDSEGLRGPAYKLTTRMGIYVLYLRDVKIEGEIQSFFGCSCRYLMDPREKGPVMADTSLDANSGVREGFEEFMDNPDAFLGGRRSRHPDELPSLRESALESEAALAEPLTMTPNGNGGSKSSTPEKKEAPRKKKPAWWGQTSKSPPSPREKEPPWWK